MELGEKLKQAREEAGLSQRTLCGERITRNMLSQIEHGTARPSMDTLGYLAAKLGKPISFFLDENVIASPNGAVMAEARRLYDNGSWAEAVETLKAYRGPDAVYDREQGLLLALCRLNWAADVKQAGRGPYAREILENTVTEGRYCAEALERRRLLLLEEVRDLPSLDEELLLRAEAAFRAGNLDRAKKLLDAAEDQTTPRWAFLSGQICVRLEQYAQAARLLKTAEAVYPGKVIPLLEQCYRQLGDYQKAYEYACKQR